MLNCFCINIFTCNSLAMRRMVCLLAVLIGMTFAVPVALAQSTNWYVAPAPTGRDDGSHDGESWDEPLATISNALISHAAADAGHVIHVSNGHYILSAQIVVNKGVTIRGVNTPGVTNTIIDGDNSVRGFRIDHANAVVEGLVISNGAPPTGSSMGHGGGVYINSGTLRDCIVTDNTSPGNRGGGIKMPSGSSGVVSNCVVRNNTSGSGGGIYIRNGLVIASHIIANEANLQSGGGIYIHAPVDVNIQNCVIEWNTHNGIRGVFAGTGEARVSDTVIRHNSGLAIQVSADGLYNFDNLTVVSNESGMSISNCRMILSNSRLKYNGFYTYSACQVLITNCVFEGNTRILPGTSGGTLHFSLMEPDSIITHSRIANNTIYADGNRAYGGGIRIENVDGFRIEHCEIVGNVITNTNNRAWGAGIYMLNSTNCVIRNCLIADNRAEGTGTSSLGGGLYINNNGDNLVESCTIAGNYTLYRGGGFYFDGTGNQRIVNSVVFNNSNNNGVNNWYFSDNNFKTNITYTCTPDADGSWGTGCIAGDPMFVDAGAGNYRLAAGSPCINAGINEIWMTDLFDLDGRPRLDRFTRQVDIGCYEYLSSGTLFYVQ